MPFLIAVGQRFRMQVPRRGAHIVSLGLPGLALDLVAGYPLAP